MSKNLLQEAHAKAVRTNFAKFDAVAYARNIRIMFAAIDIAETAAMDLRDQLTRIGINKFEVKQQLNRVITAAHAIVGEVDNICDIEFCEEFAVDQDDLFGVMVAYFDAKRTERKEASHES